MGHHYTPKAHLKRFEAVEKTDHIWMYDKVKKTSKMLPIDAVAQEKDFYPGDVEEWLNTAIEIPGNAGIRNLLDGKHLDNQDKENIATFFVNMITRGPRQRAKSEDLGKQQVLPEVFRETRKLFAEAPAETQLELLQKQELMQKIDQLESDWSARTPDSITRLIRTPHKSSGTTEGISKMAWELIPAPPNMRFVTSDTPAHMFDWMGISRPESEYTITLSSGLALVAHNQGMPGEIRRNGMAKPHLVKEINRRIISTTQRFVFSSRSEFWIELMAKNPNLHLNAIRWRL